LKRKLYILQDLARLLPSLAHIRRPSKAAIVNGSINHLSLQREQRLTAAREVRSIFAEKQEFLEEINEWRTRNGLLPRESKGWTQSLEEVVSVESEVFGNFIGMGDGDGDGENEGDYGEAEQDGQDAEMNADESCLGKSQTFSSISQIPVSAAIEVERKAGILPINGYNPSMTDTGSMSRNSFAMPSRQLSFAPTDQSSLISGSPQLSQTFGNGSPIDNAQHIALQAFLSGNDAFAHSFQGSPGGLSAGVVTPPPIDSQINVSTFAPPSPPAAPTSFTKMGGNEEKVHEWAAQQLMMQFSGERQMGTGIKRESFDNNLFGQFGLQSGRRTLPGVMSSSASQLSSAHQALLAHQPHLAAAAFPPPHSDASPRARYPADSSTSPLSLGLFEPADPINHAQIQQFFAANAAAVASLTPALNGLTYDPTDSWSRLKSRAPVSKPSPSMEEFRDAVRAGINMGLAARMSA
jgi:hypothetical protein